MVVCVHGFVYARAHVTADLIKFWHQGNSMGSAKVWPILTIKLFWPIRKYDRKKYHIGNSNKNEYIDMFPSTALFFLTDVIYIQQNA